MFARIGIPEEILSDQGTQFMSGIMREVSRLLSMKQLTTTPYHPMCNGLVERFNGTIKTMLKRMCAERPKDWDRYVDPLLFAYREVTQESTGFSPFEMLYARTVRGPMEILKQLWTQEHNSPEIKTTYQYVTDLKDRLQATCDLAREQLMKSQNRYKRYFDSKAKDRMFKVGDKVLLLLPTDKNKLLMQ
jgi:transposase InsO family protein